MTEKLQNLPDALYLMEGETCNGEYCTTFHRSLWTHVSLAQAYCEEKLVTVDMREGEDAPNVWETPPEYETDKTKVCRFQTGDWGYIVFTIYQVSVQK